MEKNSEKESKEKGAVGITTRNAAKQEDKKTNKIGGQDE